MNTAPINAYMFTGFDGRVYMIGENQFRIESEHVAMCGQWYGNGTHSRVEFLEEQSA